MEAGRIPNGRPTGGGLYVSELQRGRLLEAAFALVYEQGYRGMTVRRVAERAGVSPKTFYVLFSDREDCFLAAFEHALDVLTAAVAPAYDAEREWVERVRAALAALLGVLDREPALRRLVFVEALTAGPRVLARRAQVLDRLAGVLDGGRAGMKTPGALPQLTAEGIVGATFGVIHARLSQQRPEPLSELLNALMATIVLPFRGSAAATLELKRPPSKAGPDFVSTDKPAKSGRSRQSSGSCAAPPIGTLTADFRLTVRTQMVLAAVAGHTGVNNREVSELVGVSDQGQISRLMMRLAEQGLVENMRGDAQGLAKAWRLTPNGAAVIDAHRPLRREERRGTGRRGTGRGKLAVKRGRAPGRAGAQVASAGRASLGFRLTVRTHMVLAAIAELGGRGSPPSNREIADAAGVSDQGQISKLLARLEGHGLLRNTGRETQGSPYAWHLTLRGEEILRVGQPRSERTNGRPNLPEVKR
jgi:AcrR family transcriptional regulator/DNA-binding MarR family transcriptional regulator